MSKIVNVKLASRLLNYGLRSRDVTSDFRSVKAVRSSLSRTDMNHAIQYLSLRYLPHRSKRTDLQNLADCSDAACAQQTLVIACEEQKLWLQQKAQKGSY